MQPKTKLAAIVLTSLLAARSDAGNNYSIGLKFGANDTGVGGALLAPTDVAGVLPQANWNNFDGASGSFDNPNANSNGVAVATTAHLEWTSAGTWAAWGSRGEQNGTGFQVGTPDRTLIGGYLDTGAPSTTSIVITNLPSGLTVGGYNVYVYIVGGTGARGGGYRIVNADDTNVVLKPYLLGTGATNPTDFVRDSGVDHTDNGSFLAFTGLTNANIIIEATTVAPYGFGGTMRAPIDAVQLVAVHAPDPSAATALNVVSNASGQLRLSWTPGAGSSGSLVIMKEAAATSRQPLDGVAYSANAAFGSGENIGGSNFVVYAGTDTNVIVTGLAGGRTYAAAVYASSGSGDTVNYLLDTPATGSAVGPASLQSITFQIPATTTQTNGIMQATVLANFDSGPAANVTANATYVSGNTGLATVNAAGLITGVGTIAGTNVTITVSYQGKTNTATINFVAPPPSALMHRYSFNGNANDSVGGANGNLNPGATIAGGEVNFDGTSGYVDIPGVVLTNLDAMSWEVWVTDNGSIRWSRIFDFGSQTVNADASTTGLKYMFLTIPNGNVGAGAGAVRTAYQIQGGGEQLLNWGGGAGARPPVGKKTHLVVTTDPQTRRCVLYADGVQVAINTGFLPTHTPKAIGTITNNWLGRSQYSGDAYFTGAIDEFRIYSNALTAIQVAVNAAAGPSTLVADPGALQTITLQAATSMIPGGLQNASVWATYANASSVNVTGAGPGPTYSSDNTNIVTVSAAGLITGVAPGTANVQANYGGKTDAKAITVAAPAPPVLTHRYSFTANANDSVGTAHGTTLQGSPTYSGGLVTLSGFDSIALPPGIVSGQESLSVEAWVYGPSFASGGPMYLFGFGDTNVAAVPANFARLAVAHAAGATPVLRSGLSTTPINSGVSVGIGTAQEAGWGSLIGPTNHIVIVFDGALRQQRIYLNGDLVQSVAQTVPVSSISNRFSYIGQSLAPNESTLFAGYLDEFRTYNGALNLEQVRTSRASGPNNPLLSGGSYTSVGLNVPAALIQGTRRLPTITGSSATVANVDLSQVATVTSSDPSVINVLPNGRLQANALGVATITATMGAVSDSKPVQVAPKQTALMHRYSFKNNYTDSVGGAAAAARGNAQLDGTENVMLDGVRGTYVELPRYLVDGYQTMTVETWTTMNQGGNWSRLFDFGTYAANNAPGGDAYTFFAPRTGGNNYRIAVDPAPGGGNNAEQGTTAGTAALDDGVAHHIVCVFQTDAAQARYLAVFLDGVQVITNTTLSVTMGNIVDDWNFIGRSLFTADSPLNASIDEFRIYHGTLTPAQVTANRTAGPNGAVAVGGISVPPLLSFSRSGNNLVLNWTDPAATLVAAGTATAAANTYTNVPGATSPWPVPPTGSELYFRLKK